MSDDKLTSLNRLETPAPSPEARQRALEAALMAFDAEMAETAEKSSSPTQGTSWAERLRSIVQPKRGTWLMDTRITYGIGTAAIVLLLLPLGFQFMSSTSLTPVGMTGGDAIVETPVVTAGDEVDTAPEQVEIARQPVEPAPVPEPFAPADADLAVEMRAKTSTTSDTAATANQAPASPQPTIAAAPQMAQDYELGRAAETMMAAPPSMEMMAAPSPSVVSPMDGATRPLIVTEESRDEFTGFTESPVRVVADEPVSTFSIDVDTASYSYMRSALESGNLPAPDAVRIEELINYFGYDYPGPETADTPFRPTVAVYPSPWNDKTQLLHIGIKGYEPTQAEDKPSNLVFLLDTSGSMDAPDKLPLLKRAFALLVNQLGANDTISIVAYAGSAGVVLEPTRATEKATIVAALDNLWAGGSTAGAEGIELAYRLAEQNKVTGGINRVILATDGDFNVGISDPDALIDYVRQKRDSGVFLSVLGFGTGNYQDDTMQALAQNGNGNAAYIDSFREARKVLVEEIGGTLETIAKDVKIQIEFNPAVVSEYRLIGYETRALNREDFNNDKVDAGDIGAGHTVTAIYEITPVGSGAELVDPLRYGQGQDVPVAAVTESPEIAFLKLRYKLPESDVSTLMDMPIGEDQVLASLDRASDDQRWAAAVAAFGQKLKGSNYGDMSWAAIRSLAQGARGSDDLGYRAEFIRLLDTAALLAPDTAPGATPE